MSTMQMLIASVPVDTATFTLWIHQNLPAFCSEVEEVEEAYDDICRADLMRADDDLVSWKRGRRERCSANCELALVRSGRDLNRRLRMLSMLRCAALSVAYLHLYLSELQSRFSAGSV